MKIKGLRVPESSSQSNFYLFLGLDENAPNKDHFMHLYENTGMCDGIGGANWDGSLVMAELIELMIDRWKKQTIFGIEMQISVNVLELGAGAGLLGLLCKNLLSNTKVILTDKEPDLAQFNVTFNKGFQSIDYILSAPKCDELDSVSLPSRDQTIQVIELPWGSDAFNKSILAEMRSPDLILGAEIAVLYKQQPLLCQTISCLAGPQSLILLSVDEFPSDRASATTDLNMICRSSDVKMSAGPPKEGYAVMLDRDLVSRGFQKRVLFMRAVHWAKLQNTNDHPELNPSEVSCNSLLYALREKFNNPAFGSTRVATLSRVTPNDVRNVSDLQEVHHICAYFKPELLSLQCFASDILKCFGEDVSLAPL